ncbi:PHP domain-containing protein [Sediminivirga luteola]|uniref:PHP domain-containing protein n=1 Tax=Sediminivirga luteola TaxID=1774748 RepID=UPI001F589EAE|nr:PHP domain-containing protein [Sediminivirga luteola]MCI2265688.1 PHP domain-containing protein [Sediminivirga luteola]
MLIDLHAHSLASDGTQTPAELVADAADHGVQVLGLTDHDTVRGWDEAAIAAVEHGVTLVRGIEVSCRYEGISVHVLAYLPAADGSELLATLEETRRVRVDRGRRIAERLSEDFPVSWEQITARAAGGTVGRPHIADALVDAGVVPDRSAAFATLLAKGSPYHVSLPVQSPLTAIRLIREAGGASVFAHPAASARGRVVPDAGIRAMIEAGLDGLEVDHRDNPPEARRALRERAAAHGLIVTGSSDYHGSGKPNRLGEHGTDPGQLARIVDRATGIGLVGG